MAEAGHSSQGRPCLPCPVLRCRQAQGRPTLGAGPERLPRAQGADGRSPAPALASGVARAIGSTTALGGLCTAPGGCPCLCACPFLSPLQACRAWSCRCPWGTCSHTLTPPHTPTHSHSVARALALPWSRGASPPSQACPQARPWGSVLTRAAGLRVSLQQLG